MVEGYHLCVGGGARRADSASAARSVRDVAADELPARIERHAARLSRARQPGESFQISSQRHSIDELQGAVRARTWPRRRETMSFMAPHPARQCAVLRRRSAPGSTASSPVCSQDPRRPAPRSAEPSRQRSADAASRRGRRSFPWHDPALPLDERLDARRRPPARARLMAAMAQLDCGAVRLSLPDLCRGDRARQETQPDPLRSRRQGDPRKLKELVAAPAAAARASRARRPHRRRRIAGGPAPFVARADCTRRAAQPRGLGEGHAARRARLPTPAVAYRGRRQPRRPCRAIRRTLVDAIIARLGAGRRRRSTVAGRHRRGRSPTRSRLACDIRRPSDEAIEVLASRAPDLDESRILQAMAEGYPGRRTRRTPTCSICSKASPRRGRPVGAGLGARRACSRGSTRSPRRRSTLRGRSPSDRRRRCATKSARGGAAASPRPFSADASRRVSRVPVFVRPKRRLSPARAPDRADRS